MGSCPGWVISKTIIKWYKLPPWPAWRRYCWSLAVQPEDNIILLNGEIEGEIFIGVIHLFYNFLYDVESEILTLFMEEKTWKRLSVTDASVTVYYRSTLERRTLALSCASANHRPVIPKHQPLSVSRSLDCVKGWVCGDMHYKYLLGFIVRVG